jgi:hypothetical protein
MDRATKRSGCGRRAVDVTHAGLGYLGVDTAIDPRGVMRQVLRATARLRRRGQAVLGAGAYGEQGFDADALMVEEV